MTTMMRLAVPLLALLALTACASGRGSYEGEDPPTILEVDNQSTFLMNIYVLQQSGNRRRLGEASSHRTTHFTIPRTLIFGITPLRFQADPVGSSRAPITNEINVIPGDTVVLLIPPGGRPIDASG